MTIWRSNSMFCVLPLKCIEVFPPALLLNSPLSKALVQKNIGWPGPAMFCSIFSAVRFQDPSGLQSKVPHRFFSDPGPRKDQWPRGNLSAYSLSIVSELFTHNSSFPSASHTMSLNIDMKMILPMKFSDSHCNSLIICWILLRIATVVNFGKIFHSNSTSCPSIRFNSLK